MSLSPARKAAFEILQRIESDRAYSSVLLPAYEVRLSTKDRSLCHELVLGVLRHRLYLDRAIDHFSDKRRIDPEVRNSLRLGLYQAYFLSRIPSHSVVNESVELVQRARKSSARGFVNAILRRAIVSRPNLSWEDEVARLSVKTSHPRWILERWINHFGFESAELLAKANNTQPGIAFRLTAKGKAGKTAIPGAAPSSIAAGAFTVPRFGPEIAAALEAGLIYLQDEGSMLVGNAVTAVAKGSFLDVCAAPGGKTTQIAANLPRGLRVAGDLHPQRVRKLSETIDSQGVGVELVRYDAEASLPFAKESFDTVLVDASCSGTGTIRHNPELRYFLDADDIVGLSRKQLRILRNASKAVRQGGTLIYSTCSLEPEENEGVANEFLRGSPEFEKAAPKIDLRCASADGFARTFPHVHGCDGFFIAQFIRAGGR